MSKKKEQAKAGKGRNTRLSETFHTLYNIALPLALLGLVKLGLVELAVAVVVISKWRVFAVRPRHWLTNLRSNSVDLVVKLSTLNFMVQTYETLSVQLAWTGWYIVWLIFIKPRSDTISVGMQAGIAQFLGLSALFQLTDEVSSIPFIVGAWIVALSSARHFLSSYDEQLARVIAYVWAFFVAQLSWVLYHWALIYVFIPQAAIIVTLLGYVAGSLYHHYKEGKLKRALVRDQLILACAIIIVLIVLANWRGDV